MTEHPTHPNENLASSKEKLEAIAERIWRAWSEVERNDLTDDWNALAENQREKHRQWVAEKAQGNLDALLPFIEAREKKTAALAAKRAKAKAAKAAAAAPAVAPEAVAKPAAPEVPDATAQPVEDVATPANDLVARIVASLPKSQRATLFALDEATRTEQWNALSEKEQKQLIRWMDNIEACPASDKVRQQWWDDMHAPRRFLTPEDMDRFDAVIEAWGTSWQAELVADLTKAKLPVSLAGPIANATGILGFGDPREAFEEWDEAGHVSFYGDWSDDLRALPIRISFASDEKSYKWPVSKNAATWGAAIDGALTWSEECEKKGHQGICQGEVKDGERRLADRMLALYGIFIDIESGDREADVRAKLLELGIAGFTYSTFSHNKPETKIKNKALMEHLKVQTLADMTVDDVRSYLMKEKGMRPWVVENITVEAVEGEHAKLVKHAVIERFRVVIPLAEAFRIVEHGEF